MSRQAFIGKSGIEVTSRWLTRKEPLLDKISNEVWRKIGIEDLADIDAADIFVLVAGKPTTDGGLFVELGYALAKRKRVIVVGELKGNPFYWLDAVERVLDWRTFVNNVLASAAAVVEYE